MFKDEPYGDHRNPELPWGYWLTVNDEASPPLLDEQGNGWSSVREYLWIDRLGMASGSRHDQERALEVLLSVLVAIDRQVISIEEKVIDLFADSWHLARQFFGLWLQGQGLTTSGLSGGLTSEGKAVLKMLASTRSRGAAPIPVGLPVFKTLNGPDLGEDPAMREAIMEQCDTFVAKLPCRFVRKDVAGRPAITLTGPPSGDNVPLARTLWSLSFPHGHERDRFYRWLVDRIDRWEDWSGRARMDGAQALSEHLLRLSFASEARTSD
ncbi:hypothetical protein K3177_13520 [Qipengyuania sp. GH25]|uniref:Uncharacterized protein n=1 Tax=Qipengyuania pacifica TaxID=2860199 RepID=A0ABS7JI04_9SPHN|nr:hypothetical protein [Qipengyuania aerophila]MBX7489536.1 hypothetical protein [Qipengyuania aerophila]